MHTPQLTHTIAVVKPNPLLHTHEPLVSRACIQEEEEAAAAEEKEREREWEEEERKTSASKRKSKAARWRDLIIKRWIKSSIRSLLHCRSHAYIFVCVCVFVYVCMYVSQCLSRGLIKD
jgi:hypothetical protein